MFIIKWFNTTLLHIFSCSQPCQTWVVFHARFLSREETFLEDFCKNFLCEWKNCFGYIQDICVFLRYCWCSNCRKRDKIGVCPSTCAQGSLVRVGRCKASVFGMFHLSRALKMKPLRPYFTPSSWPASIVVLVVYTECFLHQCRNTQAPGSEKLWLLHSPRSVDPQLGGTTWAVQPHHQACLELSVGHPQSINLVFQKDFVGPSKLFYAES